MISTGVRQQWKSSLIVAKTMVYSMTVETICHRITHGFGTIEAGVLCNVFRELEYLFGFLLASRDEHTGVD